MLGARVWPVHADTLRRRIPYAAVAESLRAITGVDTSYAAGLLPGILLWGLGIGLSVTPLTVTCWHRCDKVAE